MDLAADNLDIGEELVESNGAEVEPIEEDEERKDECRIEEEEEASVDEELEVEEERVWKKRKR